MRFALLTLIAAVLASCLWWTVRSDRQATAARTATRTTEATDADLKALDEPEHSATRLNASDAREEAVDDASPSGAAVTGVLLNYRKRHPTDFAQLLVLRLDGFSDDSTEMHVYRANIAPDGTFAVHGIESGRYTLVATEASPFDVVADEFDVHAGETVKVRCRAIYTRKLTFHVRASDRSGAWDHGLSWQLQCDVLGQNDAKWSTVRWNGHPLLERSTPVRVKARGGIVRFIGSVHGHRGRPVVPSARAQVIVSIDDHPDDEVVPVELVFDNLGAMARVTGRIASPYAYGVRVVGETSDGLPVSEHLRLEPSGKFWFAVDTSRLAGPQVTLHSQRYRDKLGPFALVPGRTDLGTLTLRDLIEIQPLSDDDLAPLFGESR